jgi:hypothetical protein
MFNSEMKNTLILVATLALLAAGCIGSYYVGYYRGLTDTKAIYDNIKEQGLKSLPWHSDS